jgi:hypothetical protein
MTVRLVPDDTADSDLFTVSLPCDSSLSSSSGNEMSQREIEHMIDAEFGIWKTEGRSSVRGAKDIELSKQTLKNVPQSQSPSAIDGGNMRTNPRVSASDDWRWEDEDNDDRIGSITSTAKNVTTGTTIINGEDKAWNIISVIIKWWCVIWVLFAIAVIAFEIFSPNHPAITQGVHIQGTKNIVEVQDEQAVLELSEAVVTSCSYSNLDTEGGREECRELCRNHMCCFVDDDGSAEVNHKWLDVKGQRHGATYSCAEDPKKMCAAFAGCQSLVVSEDDAIIYDVDGVDVFGVGDDLDDDADEGGLNHNDTATIDRQQPQSVAQHEQSSDGDKYFGFSGANSTLTSELQLVEHVINSVCSTDNLHTHHGILECASLCNPSICCFDRDEISSLNPKLDIILKMEGIDNTMLDLSEMGTCTHDGDGNDTTSQGHFCQAHVGCKNILVLGSLSAAHATHIFTDFGIYDEDEQTTLNSSAASAQRQTLATVFVLFGTIIGTTIYLLVFKREYAPLVTIKISPRDRSRFNNSDDARSSHCHKEASVEFV